MIQEFTELILFILVHDCRNVKDSITVLKCYFVIKWCYSYYVSLTQKRFTLLLEQGLLDHDLSGMPHEVAVPIMNCIHETVDVHL